MVYTRLGRADSGHPKTKRHIVRYEINRQVAPILSSVCDAWSDNINRMDRQSKLTFRHVSSMLDAMSLRHEAELKAIIFYFVCVGVLNMRYGTQNWLIWKLQEGLLNPWAEQSSVNVNLSSFVSARRSFRLMDLMFDGLDKVEDSFPSIGAKHKELKNRRSVVTGVMR